MKTLTNLFIRSLLLTAVTFAQWSSDPASPQLLGSGVQAQVKATSDGGVYVAWLTDMGGYHVYLQRFDATGVAQFDNGGMLVSDQNNESWIAVFHMNLAVDSDNNAIITVLDTRAGPWNVYAYKIAPDGSMLWGDDGVSVSNSSQTNYSPRLAVLTDNSVVVAWSPNSTTVEIQRISSDGGLMWGDGILIEDNIESLMSPQPIVNSNGHALVQWIGQSGPVWAADSKIYLQNYDLDGNAQWDNPAVAVGPVIFPMGNWSQGIIADDTGGSFSAWTQFSGNVQNAVSQHITGEGAIAWTGGVDLSTNSSNFRMSPILSVAEETQELMAVWREANGSQSERGIFAQRLDSSGNQLWGSNGVTVVALNSSYDYLDLSVAGFGEELISAYIQQSANMDGDIYANRLDAEGNLAWTDQTVTVTNSGTTKSDMMAGKGPNCLFIAWTENGSVYAHCVREDGTLGAPDIDSPDCIADDGTDGVELWGVCYSIENTDSLDLSESGLTGEIPSEIGNLTNLSWLILHNNQLTGEIPPEIGNLTNLINLSLSGNQLTGEIPQEVCDLMESNNIEMYWILTDNNLINTCEETSLCDGLTEVELWGEYYDIAITTYIDLYNQGLTGSIPPEIGCLTSLTSLWLSYNNLSGLIPSTIGNLTNLEYLSLYGNQLTGEIPSEIGNLTNLTYLSLHSNQLTGEIPSTIGNLTNLTYLRLNHNQLTGELPQEVCDLIESNNLNMGYILNGNNLINNCEETTLCDGLTEVELWGEYYDIGTTTEINLNSQGLSGSIPPEIGCLTNLNYLHLAVNQLTGEIPPEIGNLINLTYLDLDGNELTGEIPSEIWNLTNLIGLNLSYNELTGSIPLEIGNLTNLNYLRLSDNQLTGIIPDEICNQGDSSPSLHTNQLCPPYPSCIEDYVGEQDISNCEQVSVIDETLPITYNLHNAYPNPFNPVTRLQYDLPEDGLVNITIYDMMGRIVRNLVNSQQNAGYKSIQWNATNNIGQPVSAGLYLYTIQTGKFRQTKKMVLLK